MVFAGGDVATAHAAPQEAGYARTLAVQRAAEHVRYGFGLAQRCAYFTAREEFVQALRVVAKALDAEAATPGHQQALEAGLRALEEAAPTAGGERARVAALQQRLYDARQRLAWSVGGEPVASQALYALARLETLIADESAERDVLAGPKAMALHQAALAVDPANYRAANELAVLFVRYGQLDNAEQVLTHGLSVAAVAEIWHNLAVVYQRMGRREAANQAQAQYEALVAARRSAAASPEAAQTGGAASLIRWTDPTEFARSSPNVTDEVPATKTGPAAAASPAVAPKRASDTLLPQWMSRGLKNFGENRPTSQVK